MLRLIFYFFVSSLYIPYEYAPEASEIELL